jgi:hypothetical protein
MTASSLLADAHETEERISENVEKLLETAR